VLNHVCLHQTVIGLEAIEQMALAEEEPDVVIGCVGGGSNFGGIAFPFLRGNLREGRQTRFLAVEPTATPSLTRGVYAFDFGDSAGLVPILKMYTLGSDFIPDPIHAGGLRYHGMSPIVSHLCRERLVEARAYNQLETFEAGLTFARLEGQIPAPETNHAIAAVMEVARQAKEEGKKKVILFNFSGHGICDLASYDRFLNGELEDYAYPQDKIREALAELPTIE